MKPAESTAVGSERSARACTSSSSAVIAVPMIVAASSIAKSEYEEPSSMPATGVTISAARTRLAP
jgi:hypothetical protein